MATQSVKMEGVEALSKRLEGLKYDVSKKGGRFALRKAAQVVRDAARQNAQQLDDPKSREIIAKNVVERWSNVYNKRTGNLMFRVGVLGGAMGKAAGDSLGLFGDKATKSTRAKGSVVAGPGGDTRHWAYLEFGTEKAAAQPFFQRAMADNIQPATDTFIAEFNRALDRALAKMGK